MDTQFDLPKRSLSKVQEQLLSESVHPGVGTSPECLVRGPHSFHLQIHHKFIHYEQTGSDQAERWYGARLLVAHIVSRSLLVNNIKPNVSRPDYVMNIHLAETSLVE